MINIPTSKKNFKIFFIWALTIFMFVVFIPVGWDAVIIAGVMLTVTFHICLILWFNDGYNHDIEIRDLYFFINWFKFTGDKE